MILKIKGSCEGNWYLFDTDEVEWLYIGMKLNPIKESYAERVFLNETSKKEYFYRIFLKKQKADYQTFVCNTEVYILNNDGKTVETLR